MSRTMAPLYKRYIPPKTTAVVAASPPAQPVQSATAPATPLSGSQKSRKRERTEEEVAQRKAKKLKKKGLDESEISEALANRAEQAIATPPKEATTSSEQLNAESAHDAAATPQEATPSSQPLQGEFAHIKNAKKRHKLEKEARKARKTAKRIDEEVEIDETGELSPSNGALNGADGHDEEDRMHGFDKSSSAPVVEPENEAPETSEVDGNAVISQPRKRRHRLEGVLAQSQSEPEQPPQETEEHLQKHSGILGKFQKSTKLGRIIQAQAPAPTEQPFEAPRVQDLVIPEEEELPTPDFDADFALPSWLAKPTVVSSGGGAPFKSLNLQPQVVEHLAKLGFNDALPVQQALIPLLLAPGDQGSRLLPGTESVAPDIAVSAPTGSGKTIAYLVPIIEALKKSHDAGKLKALVVVPTRELVVQVAAVAESLAKGTSLRIGIATGAGGYRDEASKLVKRDYRYDPDRYRNLLGRAHQRNHPEEHDSQGAGANEEFPEQEISDAVDGLVNHVPVYESAVDIVVATPGRLLEHIHKSHGFTLVHLKWLVLDEADKLLDQQSEGLISALNEQISKPLPDKMKDSRQQFLSSQGIWDEEAERRARKIMLSATMTRDISKLVELRLRRPQLIVVRGDDIGESGQVNVASAERGENGGDVYELPRMLNEYSVHTGDGSEKPLYLVELLRKKILRHHGGLGGIEASKDLSDDATSSNDDSDSDSDSDESSSDDSSASSASEESSSDESSSEASSIDEPAEPEKTTEESSMHPSRAALLSNNTSGPSASSSAPTILIFTSSTESANRLSHLLRTLLPNLTPHIATLTRGGKKPTSTHPRSKHSDPILTISTDRAGRGLDSLSNRAITHIVQYDVPRSATSYVHRVGRTARAGRGGEAWTLFTHKEARWFVNEVVRNGSFKRIGGVQKVGIEVADEEMRERLGDAVARMREAVFGGGAKGGKDKQTVR